MSKVGRYSADRKKVDTLTTTSTSIQVADCGTIFMLNGSSYSANVTHSLPHPTDAGNGWWCKFIIVATGAAESQLDLGGDDCLIKVRTAGELALGTAVDDLLVLQIHETAGAAGLADADADFITIKGEAAAGGQLEFVTDGTKYYVLGSCTADGNITIDD